MKIKITTLIFHNEDGVNDVIHSLHDNEELAKQEIVRIFNKEEGTDFKTIEEIDKYSTDLITGAGTYLSVQELTINSDSHSDIFK